MRLTKAGAVARFGSFRDGVDREILFSFGSKSNSFVGFWKMPPNTRPICCADAAALFEMWIWCRESMLVMIVFGGITFEFPSAWKTGQVNCKPAVDGILLMTLEPVAVSPFWLIGFGPASAASKTCPFGIKAAGASSAPKLACRMLP